MAFLPSGIFTNGIFTIWHFYKWHFYQWYFYCTPFRAMGCTVLSIVSCETQCPRPPMFSPGWLIQRSMGEGSYIILFSPSDVTAFHGIVLYKESLKLFEIRVGHGFRLPSVATLPHYAESNVKQYSYLKKNIG